MKKKPNMKVKVKKHLKEDIKESKESIKEDKKLMREVAAEAKQQKPMTKSGAKLKVRKQR